MTVILASLLCISGGSYCQESDEDNPFAVIADKEDRRAADAFRGINKEWIVSDDGKVIGVDFGEKNELGRDVVPGDLSSLSSFSNLRILRLPPWKVTDRFLPPIAKLENLEELSMIGGKVTDKGLLVLAKMPRLKRVNLDRASAIGDDAMVVVADWERLEELNLEDTAVTDEGIYTIRGLTNLRYLYLGNREPGGGITNRSIDVLTTLTRLKHLRVDGTSIDEHGYVRLRQALPKCKVE